MKKKNKKPMTFSPKQEEVLDFIFGDEYDAVICDGAIRSGKTMILLIAYILWAMATFNDTDFIIAGKTVGTAQRNLVKPLKRIKYMTDNFNIKYTHTKSIMEISRGKKKNYFYVYGGVNEKSQDVVQGGTMGGVFLDEVALMPRSFVEQCIARCSLDGSKLLFSCNPEHPTHWFKEEWIDKAKEKKALYLHFDMNDNPSLSSKIKNRYQRQYSGVFFQRYVLGLWVKAEGIIYRQFSDNNDKYVLSKIPKDWVLDFVRIGIDFGGTKSKTVFTAYGCFNGFQDLVVLKNRKLDGDYTTDDLGKAYQEFEKELWKKYGLWLTARADNVESVLIRSLKTYAKYSTVKNAIKGEIFGRIKFVNSMIAMGHFWVLKDADLVIDALNNAVWNEKKDSERLDNEDTVKWIDVLDSMEYSFEEDMKKFLSIVPLLKDVNS